MKFTIPVSVLTALLLGLTVFFVFPRRGISMTTIPQDSTDRAAAAANRIRPSLDHALAAKNLQFGAPVFIRAFKEERILELFIQRSNARTFEIFRSYPIAAASGTLGPKIKEGDGQVPEGCYAVPPSGMNPSSRYHLAFNIGYPNPLDRYHQRTGSAIMVHGNQVSIGCLAMTDPCIEEIYTLCAAAHAKGQTFFRVHLFPFRMTQERMEKGKNHPWAAFWKEMQPIYQAFETCRIPPEVDMANGHYQLRISSPPKTNIQPRATTPAN